MKKKFSSILLLIMFSSSAFAITIEKALKSDYKIPHCSCKTKGHTYFAVRPQFQIGSPEYESLARRLRAKCEDGWRGGFQAVLLGGKSTNKSDLGTYFAPNCSNAIAVDGTIAINSKNLSPQNFNIFSVQFSPFMATAIGLTQNLTNPFRSTISLNPQQSVIGAGFSWQEEIYLGEHWFWYGISAPVLHVRNTMGLEEQVQTDSQFYDVQPIANETTNLNKNLQSMTSALTQECWQFGKIDNKIHKTTKLAFIQLQIGMKWPNEKCYYFDPFIGATLGTGNKPDGKLVFEPIAVHGGHYGVLWGGNGAIELWRDCKDLSLHLETNLVIQYLFRNTQKRSFDLKNKSWSRYIELYQNPTQAAQANALMQVGGQTALLQSIFLSTPGINLLTQDVKVSPGFNLTHNMAISIKQDKCGRGINAEGGYNFYARQAECISLKRPFGTESAIKDHVGIGLTNPVRDMTNDLLLNEASYTNINFANPPVNTANIAGAYGRGVISQDDLDFSSAAHPCVITHTVYGALGYNWDDLCVPIMIGLGGSYEFSGKMNTGLDRWLVWGKFGISF